MCITFIVQPYAFTSSTEFCMLYAHSIHIKIKRLYVWLRKRIWIFSWISVVVHKIVFSIYSPTLWIIVTYLLRSHSKTFNKWNYAKVYEQFFQHFLICFLALFIKKKKRLQVSWIVRVVTNSPTYKIIKAGCIETYWNFAQWWHI